MSECSGYDLCLQGQLAEAVYLQHLSHRECLDSIQFPSQKDKSMSYSSKQQINTCQLDYQDCKLTSLILCFSSSLKTTSLM